MPKAQHYLEGTDKLRELILHISLNSQTDEKYSATKLNKILFFSDFTAYLRTGKSITGVEYQKLPRGPVPRVMMPVTNDMIDKDELIIFKQNYYGYDQQKIMAKRTPRLTPLFTADEIAIVDEQIQRFRHMNATEISDYSHLFHGWELLDLKETIPYGTALLYRRELTNDEEQWVNNLDLSSVQNMLTA